MKLFPPHVRAVEALRRVVLRYSLLAAERAIRLLSRRDLGLNRGGVGVDPLELGQVPVQHLDNLAHLLQNR